MKRVYLDQNKWIDLLAIAKGKRVEQRLTDVLRVVVAGAGIGHLSFPLSVFTTWSSLIGAGTSPAGS